MKRKLYRVWYKLNEKTVIQVRTGAGLSSRGLAGPVTGQGGGGAALASALNLDCGIDSYFHGSKDEDCYGQVRLQPLSYIDDLIRSSQNTNCMRAGNVKLSCLMAEKQLDFHPIKSGFIIMGSEKFVAKARLEVKESPVMMGDFPMIEKEMS